MTNKNNYTIATPGAAASPPAAAAAPSAPPTPSAPKVSTPKKINTIATPSAVSSPPTAAAPKLNGNISYNQNDNAVTYNGKNIVPGVQVNDGVSYAPLADIRKGAADYLSGNGYRAVRGALNNAGIDDKRIGWNADTDNVTIDGRDVFKPQHNIDGTTYATEDDIQRMTDTAYNNSGNPLQWARGYVTDALGAGAVEWDDKGKNVIIGGRAITPAYVRDGKAYVDKATLDRVIADVQRQNGISGNQSVYDNYMDKSEDILTGALNQLLNRRQFSYDPDTDKSFQQLKKLREEQAAKAYKAAVARDSSGFANPSAETLISANNATTAYLNQLAAELGEYQGRARDWYDTDTQTARNNLSDALTLLNDLYYNKPYQANRDSISDANTAQENERKNVQQIFENRETAANNAVDREYRRSQIAQNNADTAGQYILNEGYGLDNEGKAETNRQTKIDNTWNNALRRHSFYKGDEVYIPWITGFGHMDDNGFYVDNEGNLLNPGAYKFVADYLDSIASAQAAQDVNNGVFTRPNLPAYQAANGGV